MYKIDLEMFGYDDEDLSHFLAGQKKQEEDNVWLFSAAAKLLKEGKLSWINFPHSFCKMQFSFCCWIIKAANALQAAMHDGGENAYLF